MSTYSKEDRRRIITTAVENELRMGTEIYTRDGKTRLNTVEEALEAIYRDQEIVIDTGRREKPLLGQASTRTTLKWKLSDG